MCVSKKAGDANFVVRSQNWSGYTAMVSALPVESMPKNAAVGKLVVISETLKYHRIFLIVVMPADVNTLPVIIALGNDKIQIFGQQVFENKEGFWCGSANFVNDSKEGSSV